MYDIQTCAYSIITACGDGECQRNEVCEVCPKMTGPLEGVCVECPQDCCPLALALILGSFFAILSFIVVLIVVVIICSIVTVSHTSRYTLYDIL